MSEPNSKKSGIVYVLKNAAMGDNLKIGRTADVPSLIKRMKDLDTTGVPLPFECVYAAEVDDATSVERNLHDTFGDSRVRSKREFFTADIERIEAAFRLTPHKRVEVDEDSGVEEEGDKIALQKVRKIREKFSFSMVDIEHHEILHLRQNEDITCTVIGNNKILFDGEEMSLSRAAEIAMKREGSNRIAFGGPDEWTYGGETLANRRKRMEEED